MKKEILLFLLILCTNLSFGQKAITEEVKKALEDISPDSIRAHIAYLSDDKLLGREPRNPEYQMAIDYVIQKFKSYGLEPAGENGTFLQKVTVRSTAITKDATLIAKGAKGETPLVETDQFLLYPDLNHPKVEVEAPVVFAGYGIHAPEIGLDDYKGIDVKGKIVLALRGIPEGLPSEEGSHLSRSKDLAAYAKDAAGFIEIYPPQYRAFQRSAKYYRDRGRSGVTLADDKAVSLRNSTSDPKFVQGIMDRNGFNTLLLSMGVDTVEWKEAIAANDYQRIQFDGTLHAKVSSTSKEWETYNVVAKISGSHEKLKQEYIVHSAHLDHVGVGRAIEGDSIYNGAHDNASGVAVALEIARAYSQLEQKPKRSIVFNMLTSEEKGLLGSLFFANQPTVNKVVANINTDMPTIITPMHSIIALGAPYSSLGDQVNLAAKHLGLEVIPDPEPEAVRFVRSDQYSFVRAGIPALHIKHSRQAAPDSPSVADKYKYFEENIYHKPADELKDEWFDFEAGRKYAQVNFLVSFLTAQRKKAPQWVNGTLFKPK